ncbi:MAG TPA: hypothetical protein VF526_13235 [Solirubrobacteraceae bacterium]|jgi:hypothetical protein
MDDEDDAATSFPPPDAGEEIADEPDPAFGETDADDAETPDEDEPDADPAADWTSAEAEEEG